MSSSAGGALRSAATALLLGIVVGAAPWSEATAQQPAPEASPVPEASPASTPADVAEAAEMTETELDTLVSPIALYPDALLAQIFVAATYPLDVVKAARWTEQNKDMPQDARAAAAQAEGWDPSIAVLAAGFPQVIGKMAADLDQTELLGDAVLAQSDDVLAAVQRMRARADAVGNLPSNDAQTVTVEGDNIAIAPTNPEVVYVPTYDSQAVYTQTASAPPVVVQPTSSEFSSGTVYVEDDDDDDTGELLATGLLSFGAGMLVNEIFEDDDWGGYWGPSYGAPIGWGGGYVRPYPPGYRGGIGNDINIGNEINIDRDRDRTRVDGDGNWRPNEDRRRDNARDKIADRRGQDARPQPRAGTREADRNQLRQKLDAKGGGAQAREQLLGAGGGAALTAGAGAGAGMAAQRRSADRQTAISDRSGGMTGANRAADRGRQSAERAGIARQDTARQRGGGRQETARGGSRPQQVQRGGSRPQAQRGGGGGRSAFNQRGGGRNMASASSRGAKSRGGGRGGGGRGGGRRG